MRLHIVPDEKVINRAIKAFDYVFPDENIFIVILRNGNVQSRYVKEQKNVYFSVYGEERFWNIVGDINRYTAIIIHFFTSASVKFVRSINHPNIYWIAWGADLYSGLLEGRGFQLYADRKILWRISPKKLPYLLYSLLYKILLYKRMHNMCKAVRKVHYFVPDSMYDEYPLLLSYYPEFSHLEYRDFFYYPIDEILGTTLYLSITKGNNIIVGNSSSPSGNHVFVFQKLKERDILHGRKVLVPLSYGNMQYADYIMKKGRQYLGDKFIAVRNFMPLEEYNRFLLSAGIFIYGNWRQEAVGNILIALFIGGKVFLEERNPLFDFYKSQGLVIFGMSELTEKQCLSPLSEEDITTNRKILERLYSKERLYRLIRENF